MIRRTSARRGPPPTSCPGRADSPPRPSGSPPQGFARRDVHHRVLVGSPPYRHGSAAPIGMVYATRQRHEAAPRFLSVPRPTLLVMSRSAGLDAWLATLSAGELEAVLRARPDALRHPVPADLASLADRLSAQPSVNRALLELSKPALQVAEALLALGGSAPRHELLALLGATDEALAARADAAVRELSALALAWSLHGRVRLVGGLGTFFPDPLGLGRSARKLYGRLTAEQLDRIGAQHGIEGLGRAGLDAVVAVLTDPAAVRERLSRADERVAKVVRQMAWRGP